MAPETPGPDPLVSVIIPVYNVAEYLASCLESAVAHGLEPGQVEILAVDDGSTDGSSELLDELAARLPEVVAIHQPNSGGPGGPRNTGLDRARGRYVFFLDADDELTPDALRDLVGYAEEHGSEVLLGKMGGLGGRKPPTSMFTRSVVDADLVEDGLFRTLGPWKLYRRELLERQHNRFPTHLRRGEDPPFVMRAYLGASRVSVLAERDYYLIRDREDGSNLTKQPSEPAEALDRALALIAVIAEGAEPGPLRDAALWRPLQFNVPGVLGRRFLSLEDDEQARIVAALRDALAPLWNDEVARHAKGVLGTKLRLTLDGDHRLLSRLIAWDRDHAGATLTPGRDGFELALPEELRREIGAERLVSPGVKVEAKLTSLAASDGAVRAAVTLTVPQAATLPPVVLRLRGRGEDAEQEIPVKAAASSTGKGSEIRAEIPVDLAGLAPGVWDLFVVLRFPEGEISRRLGGKRAPGVSTDSLVVPGAPGEQPRALAYFTEGYGNLSLDVGFTLPKHAAPSATLLGVLTDPSGDACILEVSSPLPATLAHGTVQTELAHTRLSATTVLVRLPAGLDPSTEPLWVRTAAGSARATPAADLRPTRLPESGSAETAGQPGARRRRWFGGRG